MSAEELRLRPTTLSADGDAVARDGSGRVVFIPGALPGELVTATVVAERPKSATAALVTVLEPSAERVVPPCAEVARGCGGCQWQHLGLESQRHHKEEIVANALRVAGVPMPALSTQSLAPWSFRTSVRAGVTGGRAGFRALLSHRVVAVEGCMVIHPLLADLLLAGRYGDAEEVLLRCGARTGERLVATEPAGTAIEVPEGVQREYFHEEAAGRPWRISAGSFFQSRPDGVDALAKQVLAAADGLGEPGEAIDLYSGVGLFAGVLAARGWRVTAVESAAGAVRDARVNLAGLAAQVVRSDVARWRPQRADLVVADPSRKGLGRRGVGVVAATGARRVVLVSCDAISLGRDAGQLVRAGYALTSVTAVDLFPHTFHVEVVSVFDR